MDLYSKLGDSNGALMAKVLDCVLEMSEFELHLRYFGPVILRKI